MTRLLFGLLIGLLCVVSYAAEDTRHPLTAALDNDANLVLVADLGLTNRQLLDVLTASRAARQAVAARETTREQLAQQSQALLARQAQALAAGQPVPDDITAGLADIADTQDEAYEKMLTAVGAQVRQVRRTLAPEQARIVDWTAPAEASATEDDAQVLEELRVLGANLSEALRMLERIRYLIVTDYATTRINRLEEYLRQHMRPGTPQFIETREWLLGLLEEVRMVKEDEWPQQAPLYASQVLQRVGLLQPRDRANGRANYNWWDVYYLLADPQSPQMLQAMLEARGNVAGDE